MFAKLAFRNVKRQLGNYLIYFITVSLTIALMFAFNSVIFEKELLARADVLENMRTVLIMITVAISLIVAFVLGYATSFMLKLRKREFGTYLTLGMTRGNMALVFLVESVLLCVVSLATGVLLGLGLYQGLMAIIVNIIDINFSFASYSLNGLLLTVGLVLGVFALSFAVSAIYLSRVSIYNLLNGAKKTEKAVRYPIMWCVIAVAALVGIIVSIIVFAKTAVALVAGSNSIKLPALIVAMLAVFAVCVVVLHVGLSRGVIGLLMRTQKFKSRGANIFTLRQLSGKLSASSVLIGMLAFLLTLAVIGTNVSFTMQIQTNAILDTNYPFDVQASIRRSLPIETEQDSITFDQAEKIVQKYSPIKKRVDFTVYTTNRHDVVDFANAHGAGYWADKDMYIEESAFNGIYGEIGYKPVKLGDGFMIVSYERGEKVDFSAAGLTLGGKRLDYKGFRKCSLPVHGVSDFLVVVPDGATDGMKEYSDGTVFSLKNKRYDAIALHEELMVSHETSGAGDSIIYYTTTDYGLREYARLTMNMDNAVWIVTALYVAVVFMFLAMAMLALKTLSGVSDDKQRYITLSRIGASRRDMSRTLFMQIFTFFALPFAFPFILGLPMGIVCSSLTSAAGLSMAATQTAVAAGIIAVVMLAVYALYFTATYLVSKRAVVPVN
ncbi:MAG: FtsX-like permease family protein [Clostridiales bacterium]|nr:FtsX-like permease family protein [Clostridiales bacterium]